MNEVLYCQTVLLSQAGPKSKKQLNDRIYRYSGTVTAKIVIVMVIVIARTILCQKFERTSRASMRPFISMRNQRPRVFFKVPNY